MDDKDDRLIYLSWLSNISNFARIDFPGPTFSETEKEFQLRVVSKKLRSYEKSSFQVYVENLLIFC